MLLTGWPAFRRTVDRGKGSRLKLRFRLSLELSRNRYLTGALGQVVLALSRTQTFYGVRYRRGRPSSPCSGPDVEVSELRQARLTRAPNGEFVGEVESEPSGKALFLRPSGLGVVGAHERG